MRDDYIHGSLLLTITTMQNFYIIHIFEMFFYKRFRFLCLFFVFKFLGLSIFLVVITRSYENTVLANDLENVH